MSSRTSNDKPVTRGVNHDHLRGAELGPRRAGWSESVVPPSREGIRAAIESQICPWCGKGPFAMLPVHTNKVHAVDKYELRDLAGLTTADPLISADARQKMREHAATLTDDERRQRALRAADSTRGVPYAESRGKRRWTRAARVSADKETCIRGHAFTPENTYINPANKNARGCRKCHALRQARRRERGV